MSMPFHPEGLSGYDNWKLATPPEYSSGERAIPDKRCRWCGNLTTFLYYPDSKCLNCLHKKPK